MAKRITTLFLCLIMLISVINIAGCSGKKTTGDVSVNGETTQPIQTTKTALTTENSQSTEKTKITFMGWGADAEVATFQAMIDEFEKVYTDVQVEYIVVPSSDYDTKLQTMIASGDQPDVFYCSVDYIMKYAATGNLYDMTDYVAKNDIFDQTNVWPKAIDLYRFDGTGLGKGSIYALPKDISAYAVVYNKDLFKSAGITAPTKETPWTWDDYLAAAKKLTSGEGDSKVYGTSMYSLESAVWSNGADWLDSTLSKVTIDTPEFINALQWVADLRLVQGVAPTAAEETSFSSYDRFLQGKLGMMGLGSWGSADLWKNCKFEWDIMAWPVSPSTGKNAIWFGSAGLAVSPNSKNIEASCNLAAYLAFNKDAQKTSYTSGQSVPTLLDMANGEYLKMDSMPKNKQAFLDILADYGRLATQSRTFNQEWWSEFNSGIDDVYTGAMTAEDYCKSVKGSVQDLLDKSIEQQKALTGN